MDVNHYPFFSLNKEYLYFNYSVEKYLKIKFNINFLEYDLNNCCEINTGKRVNPILITPINDNIYLFGEYKEINNLIGIFKLSKDELSLNYNKLDTKKIILDKFDSHEQNDIGTYYDTPTKLINFKNKVFLYQRWNSFWSERHAQLFIYDNFENIEKKKYTKHLTNFVNTKYVYFSNFFVINNIIYSISFTYDDKNGKPYKKGKIKIFRSFDGVNFKLLKIVGNFLEIGHGIHLDIKDNKLILYTGFINIKNYKLIIKKHIFDNIN